MWWFKVSSKGLKNLKRALLYSEKAAEVLSKLWSGPDGVSGLAAVWRGGGGGGDH